MKKENKVREAILQYKKKTNLANSDLAVLFGVHRSTISHWISGYSSPSEENCIRIVCKTKRKITLEDLGVGDVDI